MFGRDYQFWMGGRSATHIDEITSDPRQLDDGNFWAVVVTFEGEYQFVRFKKVEEKKFETRDWTALERPWISSLDEMDYMAYVSRIRQAISEGGVYQVNACRILHHYLGERDVSLAGLFSRLQSANPAPYSQYLKIPGLEIASASPELFLSRTGRQLKTSPIKGTLRQGATEFGEKDKAENLMIVDLMRNDLGRICLPGSVEVAQLFRHEQHPGLTHLVSDVVGTLRNEVSWSAIFEATIAPGSVSGAPKSAAVEIISREEGLRGPYCGALGWIHGDQAELAVGIRTFWKGDDNVLRFGTGAGITWGSDPHSEWEETQLKARHLISLAGGQLP